MANRSNLGKKGNHDKPTKGDLVIDERIVIWASVVAFFVLLFIMLRISINIRNLNMSLAKLGFVIREDAKKYFDEAAQSILETNNKFEERYVAVVEKGTSLAISNAGDSMERAISTAQREANTVILAAREESQRIIEQAKLESARHREIALDQSASTIQWVLGQYMDNVITTSQHEEIIKSMVDQYLSVNKE